jgi:hypothetical protein
MDTTDMSLDPAVVVAGVQMRPAQLAEIARERSGIPIAP